MGTSTPSDGTEAGRSEDATAAAHSYPSDETALLVIDPYNDFLSEGGASCGPRPGRSPKVSGCSTICAPYSPRHETTESGSSSCPTTGRPSSSV
jgi:hypothetical protein